MANYLLALGGTGAKILESFVHLSAAGVTDQETRLVLLDQDGENGNGSRTETLVTLYEKLNKALTAHEGDRTARYPFATRVTRAATMPLVPERDSKPTLVEICRRDPNFSKSGSFEPQILDCLFSQAEQEKTLEEGFGGLPSLGSLVFARQEYAYQQAPDTEAATARRAADSARANTPVAQDLQSLIDQIAQDAASGAKVQVFLAGSIYGGTGASGFPTIARLISRRLRGLKNVSLGGVLSLPYFTFAKQPETERARDPLVASSDRFIHQSIDTIPYYQRLLEQERGTFSSLYLVGAKPLFALNYFSSGGTGQANPPLLCELYAALFAQHFFSQRRAEDAPQGETTIHYVGSGLKSTGEPAAVQWDDLPHIGTSLRSALGSMVRFCAAYHFHYFPQLTGNAGSDGARSNRPSTPNPAVQAQSFFKRFFTPFESTSFDVLAALDRYAIELLLYWGRMERHSYVEGVDGFPGINLVTTRSFTKVEGTQGEILLHDMMPPERIQGLIAGQLGKGDAAMNAIRTKLDDAKPADPRRPQPIDFFERLYEACKI